MSCTGPCFIKYSITVGKILREILASPTLREILKELFQHQQKI